MGKSCFKGCFCSKEGVVNKDNCHSKLDLESSTQVVYEQQQQASKILDQVQDDSIIRTTKAFTLIELLVVVLIIGILAAVAVPQYQRAVEKSHALQIQTYVNSVIKAQNVYYLGNGYYAYSFKQLDIDITNGSCSLVGSTNILNCAGFSLVMRNTDQKTESAALILNYCPTLATPSYNTCVQNKFAKVVYRFPYATGQSGQSNNTWVCNIYNTRANFIQNIFC